MELKVEIKLSKQEVINLLTRFDDSSDHPLHEGLDFDSYGDKLSKHAHFVLAYSDNECIGYLAYYLNDDGGFIYVPQAIVHKCGRHQGVGHMMFDALYNQYMGTYSTIKLEVLKENLNARKFYEREGFYIIEDRKEKYLMNLDIR